MRVLLLAGTLSLAYLAGCSSKSGSAGISHLDNKSAPDFELTALDGGKVKLSDFRGRPVLLAFFAYG